MTKGKNLYDQAREKELGPELDLRPTDMLPSSAKQDPRFDIQKPAFAMSQDPELARRYGVVRNGILASPDQLLPKGKVTAPPEPGPAPPAPVRKAPSILKPEEGAAPAEKVKLEVPEMPEPTDDPEIPGTLDLAMIREAVTTGVLNNDEQRIIVEGRLKGKIDIADMLLDRPVRQTVVIIPDRLEITFEAIPYKVELMMKQMIAAEADSAVYNEYLMDKFVLMGVACAVESVNGNKLPALMDAGIITPKMIEARLEWMLKRPVALVTMLSIHYHWFYMRQMKALQAVDLKNG